jgi:hypothetical protein
MYYEIVEWRAGADGASNLNLHAYSAMGAMALLNRYRAEHPGRLFYAMQWNVLPLPWPPLPRGDGSVLLRL